MSVFIVIRRLRQKRPEFFLVQRLVVRVLGRDAFHADMFHDMVVERLVAGFFADLDHPVNLVGCLGAQDPATGQSFALDLRTPLDQEPTSLIHLVPTGCWDGLLLSRLHAPSPGRRDRAEATVEVWTLLPPSSPRQEAFGLYLNVLRERLSRAWLAPPPKLQSLELSEIMLSDPSQPQKLDLTRVKNLQDRFNRMPPNGSPVNPR